MYGKPERKVVKRVVEKLALEAEIAAWDETNPVNMLKLIERINTLNQLARRMDWYSLNGRLQKAIDKLQASVDKVQIPPPDHGSTG